MLRGIMEIYIKLIRFCFICNDESRIIDVIKLRCCIMKFRLLMGEVLD